MITGFNTDVDYDGRVYHVQTEDRGLAHPSVESLVYSGGEIVASRRTSYAELAASPDYSEPAVQRLMETQHQALVREILGGRFDPDGPKPFGSNIITNRSLDEVVREMLATEIAPDPIRLEIEGAEGLTEGRRAELAVRAVLESSGEPVAGARVAVKLISTVERPRELFVGKTDAAGRADAVVDIPELPGASAALVCQVDAGETAAEVKRLIRKPSA